MFKKILIALGVILAVFAVVVQKQPSHFRVERSITIAAAPAVVFENVNDLHKWEQWSPWAKKDPAAKVAYDGPLSGTGSGFSWDGNKDVGAGKMTITESVPSESVVFRLDFEKPFKGTNTADFKFTPEGASTVVTWGMEGENNFMFKAVGLFMDCDKMIGGDFENGLADLKKLAETPQVAVPAATSPLKKS